MSVHAAPIRSSSGQEAALPSNAVRMLIEAGDSLSASGQQAIMKRNFPDN